MGTITAMMADGMGIPSDDVQPLLGYLSTHFEADKLRLTLPVDINKATHEVLRPLPPLAARAEDIARAREAVGRLDAPEALLKIGGTTQEQLGKVRRFITTR